MVKIALDAGHGKHTPGKRTPDDEREWSFNDKVLRACAAKLQTYQDVEVLRLDDSSGKADVLLKDRTDRANEWKADVLVSIHHNASTGKWHGGGGVETYVFPSASTTAKDIAKRIHPRIVNAMGLRDRGIKTADFHMLRESQMPAVLTEGGFMDSTVDIHSLRSDVLLKKQGEAIAEGLALHFKLVPKKEDVKVASEDKEKNARADASFQAGQDFVKAAKISDGTYPRRQITRQEFWAMLERYDRYLNSQQK
ncbi:N-acetylmuramoyl-L-alanine amidase [Sporosarcina highlanderae]|uniref:N-acetylmuramoyl-L-alanine amidase n=1 Tax=Sporosarcina highlanderae TaxID=3035916 RepID=A0ABT8JVB2_9BACL|nr:N-acetylmuramoyl-L-alanine amidase [Sporosarcina highlanderae]MDN4609108.1 N-acetylmuramoyl-L-alanine amidase [Sporosarcina highlanderae]